MKSLFTTSAQVDLHYPAYPAERLDFVEAKFYCLHALVDGN